MIKKVPSDLLAAAVIFVLAVLMALPLFTNAIITTHGADVFTKAVSMHQSWRDGDFTGRWTPYLVHGYGYPAFNFYAPLFFYVAAALMFLPISVFLAFNLTVVVFLFLSGVSMYVFARAVWGRAGGMLSAVAYLFIPYHIVDLYVRGALAEFSAFAMTPLVFWALYRLGSGFAVRYVVAGAFATAGLILTHTISSLLFVPAGFCYLTALFFTVMKRDIRRACAGLAMLTGGIALSAYFWLPALLEKRYVQIERLVTGYYEFSAHFVSLGRLLYSSWSDGSAFNVPVMIGAVHLLLVAAVAIAWRKVVARVQGAGVHIAFFLSFFLLACIFMLPFSSLLWRTIPFLSFVQFPWRFLICTSFALSFLAGAIVIIFDQRHRRKVLLGVGAAVVASGIFYCQPFGYQKISYSSPREYLRVSMPMDNMEYLPRAVRSITLTEAPQKLQVWAGHGSVLSRGGTGLDELYKVQAVTPLILGYHTYYFPGWEVRINGRVVDIHADNPYGLIAFTVRPGEYDVRIRFGGTRVRQVAGVISMITAFFLLLFLGKDMFRRGIKSGSFL